MFKHKIVAALVLSNSPWVHIYEHVWETQIGLQLGSLEFTHSLREWINDGMMTLFFFLVAPELKRELVLGGSLLTGIGFTMALFIASMAFNQSLIDSTKLGIFLASVSSAVAGLALLLWLPTGGKITQVKN